MLLYHYRPYQTAMIELEKQTLYFADYQDLNDPMEGYLNVVWQGDEIAWKGLMRNYVCSLDNVLSLYLLKANREEMKAHAVLRSVHAFDEVPYGEILDQLGDEFLNDEVVIKIVRLYGAKQLKCSRKELQAILRLVHFRALSLCIRSGVERHTMPKEELAVAAGFEQKNLLADISEQEYWNIDEKLRISILELVEQSLKDHIQDSMAMRYADMEEQQKDWLTIVLEYPEIYPEKLEELIHPHMYLTCFSASGTNSSMWGNYADNHSGICLVYETEPRDGKEWFPIKLPYAYHGNGTVETKLVEREFHPVKYEEEVIESNFFMMLGTLTGKEMGGWLIDKDGTRSCCMESIYADKEVWRNQYWKCLKERYCRKMKDWSHEEEYRMLLPDTFGEFQEFEKRCIPYEMNSLKGLIFGMKVPQERKYQAIQMVRKLCERARKEDFVFYQAEYDTKQHSINIRKIS